MDETILARVTKPSRYLGGEVNAVAKDPSRVALTFALAFPDAYEVGMSHLGLKILYDILNRRPEIAAERVFAPWDDAEALMRASGTPLAGLETGRSLSSFDIVGFSLQYELGYTNVLNMLDLGGVPIRSAERTAAHPLVLAGGPCVFNPEPMAPFIDAFVLGDGEEIVLEIADLVRDWRDRERAADSRREKLMDRLAGVEGVYVPALFETTYAPTGKIEKIADRKGRSWKVRKRTAERLTSAGWPTAPVVPFAPIVHDRVAVEIARGCTRGCRFCQAGYIYRPLRERTPEDVEKLIAASLASTGYEEMALSSLSAGDYSCLGPLLSRLMSRYAGQRVSVSLPSMRVGTLSPEVVAEVRRVRKSGFTLAPEAGTSRLRDVVNKGIDEADLDREVEKVFEAGWETIKLYFMIGLPTERDEDMDGIVRVASRVREIGRRVTGKPVTVNVTVSPFAPKPFTPFQWRGQIPIEEIRAKQGRIREALRRRGIHPKGPRPEMTHLESAMARGDRRIADVIENAWRAGCRFDEWEERFDFAKWEASFAQAGLSSADFANRDFGPGDVLPWDHIDVGVSKEYLWAEWEAAARGETTVDCRGGRCTGCGAWEIGCEPRGNGIVSPPPAPAEVPADQAAGAVRTVRFTFEKRGRLRFLSHLELAALFHRAFRRAGLSVAHSQGFNPHPRISFGPALPVGAEGLEEAVDVTFEASLEGPDRLMERVNAELPAGVSLAGAAAVVAGASSISEAVSRLHYRVPLPGRDPEAVREKVRLFGEQSALVIHRTTPKGRRTFDLKPLVESIWLGDAGGVPVLDFVLGAREGRTAKPVELLTAVLGLRAENLASLVIVRTGLSGFDGAGWEGPLSLAGVPRPRPALVPA